MFRVKWHATLSEFLRYSTNNYCKNYDFVPLPLPSHYRPVTIFRSSWPMVTLRPSSWHSHPSPPLTVLHRPSPFPTVIEVTVRNGGEVRWVTVRGGEGRWGIGVSRWWTEHHHGSRWPENGNGAVTVTGQNHIFYSIFAVDLQNRKIFKWDPMRFGSWVLRSLKEYFERNNSCYF